MIPKSPLIIDSEECLGIFLSISTWIDTNQCSPFLDTVTPSRLHQGKRKNQ
jgi:hypothetical protein